MDCYNIYSRENDMNQLKKKVKHLEHEIYKLVEDKESDRQSNVQ